MRRPAGRGATLNANRLAVSDIATLSEATVLATNRDGNGSIGPRATRFNTRAHVLAGLSLGLGGQGRFDGMVTLRKSWGWTSPAGALIVTRSKAGQCTAVQRGNVAVQHPDPASEERCRRGGAVAVHAGGC